MQSAPGTPLSRKTVAFLREMIASGQWPVNSRIPIEPELQQMIGVGKTTVREAVRSLANLGMLETLVGRGTFVRSRTPVSSVITDFISDFDVEQILSYRRALEIEAAQMAAVNRTDEQLAALRTSLNHDRSAAPNASRTIERGTTPGPFHHLIFEAAGSELMASLYTGVMAALRRAHQRGQIVYGASHDLRHHDHERILQAIQEQNLGDVAHAMGLHVDRDLLPAGADLSVPQSTPRIDALIGADLGRAEY